MQYLGDFAEDATVYIPFNTFSSNDPQASVTATTLIASDIKVHKDGSVTDIVTDGATIAIDFDTITGNHLITIDTSASADYSTGSDYLVRIEGATVDAGNINAIVGSFSIENRYNPVTDMFTSAATLVDLIWDEVLTGGTHNVTNSAGKRIRQIDAAFEVHSGTAQAGAATTITLDTGASATDNIYRGDRVMIVAGTGAQEHDIITAYNGTTKVATVAETWVITPDATSEFILVPASVDIETWQHVAVTNGATTSLPCVDSASISDSTTAADNVQANIGNLDSPISTAQTDLDTITGADGAALASTQQSITFQPITITAGDAIANITLAGTGTEDGFKFSRSGSGDPFDANFIGQINATVDTALTDYDAATGTELAATEAKIDIIDTNVDSILVDTASIGITKNAVFSNFEFPMVLTSDHYTAATGLTVTGEMSIDGAAFAAVNGVIAEVGSGVYQCDLTADDTNGDVITYKFSSATADDTIITVTTRA